MGGVLRVGTSRNQIYYGNYYHVPMTCNAITKDGLKTVIRDIIK